MSKLSSPEWDSSDGEQIAPDLDFSPPSSTPGRPEPPMPSLTSHPPLRLQRRPIAGNTRLSGIVTPGASPSSSPLPPRRTSSPTSQADFAPVTTTDDEPTFACQYCHVVFKKIGHLNRHTLKHVGTRFACEVPDCDKTFSRQDNMRTHVKNMHPNHNLSASPSPFIHHKVVRTPDSAMSGSSSQSHIGAIRTQNKSSSRSHLILSPGIPYPRLPRPLSKPEVPNYNSSRAVKQLQPLQKDSRLHSETDLRPSTADSPHASGKPA